MSVNLKELYSMSKYLKLLYVEDDTFARKTTLMLLENLFDDITIAVDGQDGLDKFNDNKFDLIISDINMPYLDGIEMLQEIRKTDTSLPILLLSAYTDSEYLIQAISLNVDGYIIKPLSHEQFLCTIYKIVKKIKLLVLEKNYQTHLENEVKSRNEEIVHKLNFDQLTSLLSRYSFFRDINNLLHCNVMLVDINKFRIINEVYGNTIGSVLLKRFAIYLSLAVEDEFCKIYRLSSDEFAIIDDSNDAKCEDKIESIFNKLNKLKINIDDNIITVDIAIGYASNSTTPYECAKLALDYAKKYSKSYIKYTIDIDHRKKSSLTLKCRDDISSALDENRIVAVYQPIVNQDSCVVKHETLMRMQDSQTKNLIAPFYFLDVAMKTRLYEELSDRIIFRALQSIYESEQTLSINLAYTDIKNNLLGDKLESFFMQHKEVGKRTIFEITEDESIENYEIIKTFILRFRIYGVKIAIDDFGTGFSNFEYILEIEPDYLKIDGSLIKDINTDSRAYTLVQAIVEFSHKLGISVIAEYVHSKAVFDLLKELDVDEYQGYYFSQPLTQLRIESCF